MNAKMSRENYQGSAMYEVYSPTYDEAVEAGWEHWVDSIPVSYELKNFWLALKAKRPSMQAGVGSGGRVSTSKCWVFNKLLVSYPDARNFHVGVVSVDKEGKYCVTAPSIHNNRFKDHERRQTIKTTNLKSAVTAALQHLKPLTWSGVYKKLHSGLSSAIMHIQAPAKEKYVSAFSLTSMEIADEIAHMLASGYRPVTKAFRDAMDMVVREGAEVRRLREYKPNACLVWSKQNSLCYGFREDGTDAVEITDVKDIPEHIANKIAVLNVADEMSPIPDVGVRLNKSMFWVFV